MVMPRTGNGVVQIALRLPEPLRDQIRNAAVENGRSINSEIVARLEGSFEQQEADYMSMPMRQFRAALEHAIRDVVYGFNYEEERKAAKRASERKRADREETPLTGE